MKYNKTRNAQSLSAPLLDRTFKFYQIVMNKLKIKTLYRVSHILWQFPGKWLQIVNYDRYSKFEAIFEMPCLFSSRKVQKITHSAQTRGFELLFFKATLGADFFGDQ